MPVFTAVQRDRQLITLGILNLILDSLRTDFHLLKWDASSRWPFGPNGSNSACGSIETMAIVTTPPPTLARGTSLVRSSYKK